MREVEEVAKRQAETRAMRHDLAIAIDDVRPVIERVALIEGEEFILDGDRRIACGGDRRKQVERAAEFLVEDGAGQVVAALRASVQKESAAQLFIRLVDRDVLTGHLSIADEQCGRRQSAKPAADDMRLHLTPP